MIWILAILFAISCFFIWCTIHELSHVYIAHRQVGLEWWKIKPWPHEHEQIGRVWGSCSYMPKKELSRLDKAQIALAPRWLDLVACVGLVYSFCIPWPFMLFWIIFWGAGVIDLINGSIGWSEKSDLQRLARNSEVNPWLLRAIFLLQAFCSISLAVILLLT